VAGFAVAQGVGRFSLAQMAIQFSTDTFAVPSAREPMCANVSVNAAEGSPGRNVLIAAAIQPETKNFNGVFRVTERPETL